MFIGGPCAAHYCGRKEPRIVQHCRRPRRPNIRHRYDLMEQTVEQKEPKARFRGAPHSAGQNCAVLRNEDLLIGVLRNEGLGIAVLRNEGRRIEMLRNEATPNVAAGLNAVLRSFALPNNRAFVACYRCRLRAENRSLQPGPVELAPLDAVRSWIADRCLVQVDSVPSAGALHWVRDHFDPDGPELKDAVTQRWMGGSQGNLHPDAERYVASQPADSRSSDLPKLRDELPDHFVVRSTLRA